MSSEGLVASLDEKESEQPFTKKKDMNLIYAKNCDHKALELKAGMRFKDLAECKEAVKQWAILNGHNIKWHLSSSKKLQAKCQKPCKWVMYASKVAHEPTCVIRTYPEKHECLWVNRNRQVNSVWIAKTFIERLKRNPQYPVTDMQAELREQYGVHVSLTACYRGRDKFSELVKGSLEAHYSKLVPYLTELTRMDREGRFELKTYLDSKDMPVFQRVYIGFSVLQKGFFVGCIRFIGLDACFLKTRLGGAMLVAVKDCNRKMYPIAWAVVEKENREYCYWFLEKLFEDFRVDNGLGWTIMSDK